MNLLETLRINQEPAVQELVAEVENGTKKGKNIFQSFTSAVGKALEVGANAVAIAPVIEKFLAGP